MREELIWHPSTLDNEIMGLLDRAGAREVKIFSRRVRDGSQRAIVSCDPPDYEWHLTITHTPTGRHKERYPTWEEVTYARYELLPGHLTMALYLPPIEEVHQQMGALNLIEVKSVGD
jgi:hypothetical protein